MSTITIRMYWQHDLDLIALAQQEDFSIGLAMKEALKAYIRGTPYSMEVPRVQNAKTDKAGKPIPIENCTAHFILNPVKDADIISFLNTLRLGYRNNAIKMIFRAYLDTPNIVPYLITSEFTVKTKGHTRGKGNKKKTAVNTAAAAAVLTGKIVKPAIISTEPMAEERKEPSPEPVKAPVTMTEAPVYEAPVKDTPHPETEKQSPVTDDNTAEDTGFNLFGAINNMF